MGIKNINKLFYFLECTSGSVLKNPRICVKDVSLIPGSGRSMEKEMASHFSVLAWENPQTEKSSGLQFKGLQRVGHDFMTKHTQTQSYLYFKQILTFLKLVSSYFS